MPTEKSITIENCPLCGSQHVYALAVDRSAVVALTEEKSETARTIEFTRLFTCPNKNATFQAKFILHDTPSDPIKSVTVGGLSKEKQPNAAAIGVMADEAQAVTPHNAALYEAGKKLLLDSVSIGQEFCKFMIGSSTGAIPIYIGLLTLILPKGFLFHSFAGVTLVAPACLFLLSSIVFTIGLLPRSSTVSLDLPAEIDAERSATISRRTRFSIAGLCIHCAAVVSGILICIHYLIATVAAASSAKP